MSSFFRLTRCAVFAGSNCSTPPLEQRLLLLPRDETEGSNEEREIEGDCTSNDGRRRPLAHLVLPLSILALGLLLVRCSWLPQVRSDFSCFLCAVSLVAEDLRRDFLRTAPSAQDDSVALLGAFSERLFCDLLRLGSLDFRRSDLRRVFFRFGTADASLAKDFSSVEEITAPLSGMLF